MPKKEKKIGLSVQEENYCLLVADGSMSKKDAYRQAKKKYHKTDGALRAAIANFHNQKHVKARIKELQEESNQIRKESVRKSLQEIPYYKREAFNDYIILYKMSIEKGNPKAGVSAIDSIVKLLGLAEQSEGEILFKIVGQKKDDSKSGNNPP